MSNFWPIYRHDLNIAFRKSAETLNVMAFFVISATLFPLALGAEKSTLEPIAAGIIWVCALMASLLGVPELYRNDAEDGTLDQYRMLPMAVELVVLAKSLAHWCYNGLMLIIIAPILAVMLQMPQERIASLLGALLLGTPILTAIGSLGAALMLKSRKSGVITSLLVLPLCVPVLIFGSAAASGGENDAFILLAAMALGAPPLCTMASAVILRRLG